MSLAVVGESGMPNKNIYFSSLMGFRGGLAEDRDGDGRNRGSAGVNLLGSVAILVG